MEIPKRFTRQLFVLMLFCLASALAQDVFDDWYPEPLRFTLEIRLDGELAEEATYWIGARALRGEVGNTTILLVDEEGPVLYVVDEGTGDVERWGDPDLALVGTVLPFGSAAHPCSSEWPCSRTGQEALNGRPVEVWEVAIPGLGETTAWVDVATRVQLQSRGVTGEGAVVTSEVVEFEVGPQPPELFVPPAGN